MKSRTGFWFNCLVFSVASVLGVARGRAAPAPAAPMSAQEQKLKAQYETMLVGLQAELAKAIPAMAEDRKAALQRARTEVAKARAAAKTAQEALGKVGTAKALVDHANGKWLGGAAKGIAAAEAALKKATSDAERAAANKELAKWQANREDGLKALAERQAALTAAKQEEPKLVAANKAAQEALAQAEAAELAAANAALKGAEGFLAADKLDAKLVRCAVLFNATPKGLAKYAALGAAEVATVERLLADDELMKAMLVAGGAEGGNYGQAAQIYATILKAHPEAATGLLQRLALAVSLEHAVPIEQSNP